MAEKGRADRQKAGTRLICEDRPKRLMRGPKEGGGGAASHLGALVDHAVRVGDEALGQEGKGGGRR